MKQPPTFKQLDYLRRLGHKGSAPADRREASGLIAWYTRDRSPAVKGGGYANCSTAPTTTAWKARDSQRYTPPPANVGDGD